MSISSSINLPFSLQNLNTLTVPVPSTTTEPLSLEDKKEIHNAKIKAAFGVVLTGPVPYWLGQKPETIQAKAQARSDVLEKKRSLSSGIKLETEKQKALMKAISIPYAGFIIGNLYIFYHIFNFLKNKPKNFTWIKHSMEYSRQNIKAIWGAAALLIGFGALCAGAYKYFEKPESPDFNKQL
jgi:uncharacterized membrane protein